MLTPRQLREIVAKWDVSSPTGLRVFSDYLVEMNEMGWVNYIRWFAYNIEKYGPRNFKTWLSILKEHNYEKGSPNWETWCAWAVANKLEVLPC